MAKKKSKLKSALKKIGKAAAVAGAGYLAMKGFKNRKAKSDLAGTEDGKGGMSSPSVESVKNRMTSDRAYTGGGYKDSIMSGGKGNMYEDKYKGTPLRRIQNSPLRTDGLGDMDMKDGGRARHKSGGSVKKSMGKALRGGGKVMR
jgi:hypothetical protein